MDPNKPRDGVNRDHDLAALDVRALIHLQTAALEAAANAIVLADRDGRIVWVNSAFTKLTGYSREEAVGQNPRMLNSGWQDETFYRDMWHTVLSGSVWHGEIVNKRKDGSLYTEHMTITSVPNDEGGIGHFIAVKEDITARKQTELDLHRIQIAMENAHDAVLIAEWDGMVTYTNQSFRDLFQCTTEEIRARGWESIFVEAVNFETVLHTVLDGGIWRGKSEVVAQRGGQFPVEVCGTPLRDDTGSCTGILLILNDVTSRKELEDRARHASEKLDRYAHMLELKNEMLEGAKERAEEATRSKSEFLANMSHEIRTPMTAILGFTENMLDPNLSDSEKLNAVHTIRRNGEQLLQIINDILDISKIEAGKLHVELIRCSPIHVVAEVQSLMQVRADAKELSFDIEYVGAIPETVQSDPTRLKQILVNLIGNAIKFTDAGGVRLVTRFVDANSIGGNGPTEPMIQFDVIDSGIGMTPDQVDRLFQSFSQADASTTRKYGGTGLGLIISKRLSEMLGGDISVFSKPGKGSTFRVTLATGPLEATTMLNDPAAHTIVQPETVVPGAKPVMLDCRILLAEDGPDNQRLIGFILGKAGAEVTVVDNGKLAVDAAIAARNDGRPFDVMLMDMQMPLMDGYEATGLLRHKGYMRPIIALTAHAMASDRKKCLDAGCDDYASKPINRRKLIELIRKYLPDHAAADTGPPQPGVAEPTVTSASDSAGCGGEAVARSAPEAGLLNSNQAGDPDMVELLEQFVERLPKRIAALEEALAGKDLERLRALAHQMSGAAGSYGFPPIAAVAKRLEEDAKTLEYSKTLDAELQALADLCLRAQPALT